MISLPPSERDLHAYVDQQLSDADRRLVETFLASNAEVAAQVRAWQQDAQTLRAALSGALQQPANPDLDPAVIRQHLKRQSRRHLASAAVLLIAVSVGVSQLVVDVGVQVSLAGGHADHLSLRREGRLISPSLSWRRAWRARDRRDITVPVGTSRISATSL